MTGSDPAVSARERPLPASICDLIDHTLLSATARADDVERLCREAVEHDLSAICVNGMWVEHCATRLADTGVKIVSVVGFPLGATPSGIKCGETAYLLERGADEIDMVAMLGQIVGGAWPAVKADIEMVVDAAGAHPVKVIVETAAIGAAAIAQAARVAIEGGAAFVKSSTGFHAAGGATVDAVRILRRAVGSRAGVKAAGGIRDCATALSLLRAGASRLGTSCGVTLATCLGSDPNPLADLVRVPALHDARCQLRS